MKSKAKFIDDAENAAKSLELEELHRPRLKLEQEEWMELWPLPGDRVEARAAAALKPVLSAVCVEVTRR